MPSLLTKAEAKNIRHRSITIARIRRDYEDQLKRLYGVLGVLHGKSNAYAYEVTSNLIDDMVANISRLVMLEDMERR